MWTADGRRSLGGRRGQRGVTLVEVAIVIVFVSALSLVVQRAIQGISESEQYLSGTRRVIRQHQRTALELRRAVGPSRRIFHANGIGEAYLQACDLSHAPPAPGARLPVIDEVRPLGPDLDGEPLTGNILLVAQEGDPAPCVSRPASLGVRLVDTFRFICVYPSGSGVRLDPHGPAANDLVLWWSRPYPSAPQLRSMGDAAERAACVRDLVTRFGCDVAWDPSAAAGSAFFALDAAGTLSDAPRTAPAIEEDLDVSRGGLLVYNLVQLARTDARSARRKSLFTRDAPDAWAPDGFEVKVVGPSGARRVWLRLSLEAAAGPGRLTDHVGTTIIDVRDM